MKCYQPNYPRPQFVRAKGSWENLNGSWDFSFDDANEGIAKKWFSSFPIGPDKDPLLAISVPFTFEFPFFILQIGFLLSLYFCSPSYRHFLLPTLH